MVQFYYLLYSKQAHSFKCYHVGDPIVDYGCASRSYIRVFILLISPHVSIVPQSSSIKNFPSVIITLSFDFLSLAFYPSSHTYTSPLVPLLLIKSLPCHSFFSFFSFILTIFRFIFIICYSQSERLPISITWFTSHTNCVITFVTYTN